VHRIHCGLEQAFADAAVDIPTGDADGNRRRIGHREIDALRAGVDRMTP